MNTSIAGWFLERWCLGPSWWMPSVASAQTAPPAINPADTAWMLIATALVLLMTPALAFFYGGLVRSKNALNTMMMSVISLGFVGVLWAVVGYSLAFGTGNAIIGDFSRAVPERRHRSIRREPSRTFCSWPFRARLPSSPQR